MSHTARTWIAASVFFALGVAFLWISAETADSFPRLSILFQHVGSFVLASVVIGLIFQFWQMKGLFADMWEEADIVKSLRSARLSRFTLEFQDPTIPWAQWFKESDHVTMLFFYATTWGEWHHADLREFLQKEKAHLEVILPDTENEDLMQALGLRFLNAAEIKQKIENAVQHYTHLGEQGKGKVSLFAFSKPMVYSCYRFNSHAVLATYRHRSDKGPIITMVGKRGGELYTFLEDELDWITSDGVKEGVTRKIDTVEMGTESDGERDSTGGSSPR